MTIETIYTIQAILTEPLSKVTYGFVYTEYGDLEEEGYEGAQYDSLEPAESFFHAINLKYLQNQFHPRKGEVVVNLTQHDYDDEDAFVYPVTIKTKTITLE